ncbi:hypothetical protein HUU53_02055 [Candidatus Micrarchaeota archaeon]|nr:hypothetical protein [Candidatus Micrarchaeota archaeon]
MKKGFIASPLIGTIIFLASLLFVVNLARTEALETSQISSEAFHNRAVSLTEAYKSDLSSIFREGLTRTIEYFLLSKQWTQFDLTNELSNLNTYRLNKCTELQSLTSDLSCSFSAGNDATNPGDPNDPSADWFQVGMPQWIREINQDFAFEGVTFKVSNSDLVEKVFAPDLSDPATAGENAQRYIKYCDALLGDNVFYCPSFEAHNFLTDDFECREGNDIVNGCEDGRYYIKVRVTGFTTDAEQVYPVLPRIDADDGFGNVLRTGAIGESDFYLPVNLPIYDYQDDAFVFFTRLSYGENIGSYDSAREGISEGQCLGGAACSALGMNGWGAPAPDSGTALNLFRQNFFDNVFKPACSKFYEKHPKDVNPLKKDRLLSVCSGASCEIESNEWIDCDLVQDYSEVYAISSMGETQSCGSGQCAFFKGQFNLRVRIEDYNEGNRVRENTPNYFGWSANPQFN